MIRGIFRPASWPISLKVPLVVAVLVVAIGTVVTERVLTKLKDIQEQNLRELADTYLDGVSSSVLPHVLRRDIWEVFDAVQRSKRRYEKINVISTIVTGPQHTIIAASEPARFASGTPVSKRILDAAIPVDRLMIRPGRPQVGVYGDVRLQGETIGRLIVTLDVSRQLTERDNIRLAMIGTNAVLTLLLAAFGYVLTRRMIRPMQVLSEHLDRSTHGGLTEIAASEIGRSSREMSALFASYNSMVRAVDERDLLAANLHEEEKLAGLGRLAGTMAHEINNPLGGMLNALETMKRHEGDEAVRKRAVGLLERGLKSIGDVVQASLASYRNPSAKRGLSERDLADLRHLLRPEIRRRNQTLDWQVSWSDRLPLDGTSIRQIGLNLLLNASSAAGPGGRVAFRSEIGEGRLLIEIGNDGEEIIDDLLECLNNPAPEEMPPKEPQGIGLWVICHLVKDMDGSIQARSVSGWTVVSISFPIAGEVSERAA